ncbi:MAG TPA: rhodanese-like domain-containing protein [Planctomycetota bacterium]
MRYFGFSAVLAVCIMGLAIRSAPAEDSNTEINRKDLKQAIAEKSVTLIDCCGTEYFVKGHIPGAIDFEANSDRLSEVLPKETGSLIVVYCSGGNCPKYKRGASAAARLGYTNIKYYGGGMHGWKKAGESVASSE